MNTATKLLLAFVPVVAIGAWVIVDDEQREARLTAKGTAVITAVTLIEDDESSSLDETEFALRLDAAGRAVETTDTLPGDRTAEFPAGHTFSVCYNPADPSGADIELDPAAGCGT